ncbi:hypothetical protein [Ruania rhizosphaerae]|uniref:hypothetical protein n=1 Tax=Ruania rhizosphaerae TaxID=1840413 RepID=UPI00135BEEB7|nr:hypothetical protein [Ruania rhizosphaerae]
MNPPRSPLTLPIAPAILTPSVALAAAAAETRRISTSAAALEPSHWVSPAARAYCDRVHDLVRAVEAAAEGIDAAAAAARVHESELDHVRQALLTGAPIPV